MPPRKEISSLRNLCFYSITLNIERHGEMFESCNDETVCRRYKLLQLRFTDTLIEKFFEIYNQKTEDEDLKRLQNFMFLPKKSRYLEDSPCLEFFFNEYTTSIFPPITRYRILNVYPYEEDYRSPDHFFRLNDRDFEIPEAAFYPTTYYFELDEDIRTNLPLCFDRRKPDLRVPDAVLSLVARKCKNLQKVNETFCCLAGKDIGKVIAELRNLQEVELGYIENEEILKNILQTCFGIRKLSAKGEETCISDKFLLCLCNHSSQSEEFTFCPANGMCSKAGKNLEYLHVTYYSSTGVGIACALQHLPLLKSLAKLPLQAVKDIDCLPQVSKGIILLQNAAVAFGQPPVILELTAMHLLKHLDSNDLHTLLISCPKLETLLVDFSHVEPSVFSVGLFTNLKELHIFKPSESKLNSSELREFLITVGKQIEVLSFMKGFRYLDFTCVHSILELCSNLKSLSLHKVGLDNRNSDPVKTLPSCKLSLQRISLFFYEHDYFSSSCRNYFLQLIRFAVNLKYLDLSSDIAENDLTAIIRIAECESSDKKSLKSLEELSIWFAKARRIPLELLLKNSDNLRKITFYGCDDSGTCAEFAKKRNYALDVVTL